MINSKNITLIDKKLSQLGYKIKDGFRADLINEILRQAINQHLVEITIDTISTSVSLAHFGLSPNID